MSTLPLGIIAPLPSPWYQGEGGWAGLVLEVRGGDGNFDGEDASRGGDGHRLSWGIEGAMAKLAGSRGMDRFFKRECDHGTE